MTQSQNTKDLAAARSAATFDVDDMTNYIYGGRDNVDQRRYIVSLIEKEPIFQKKDWAWLNHTDAVKRGIAMSARLAEIKMENDLNDYDFATMIEVIDDTLPILLHNGAFIPVISSQGTDEQHDKWLPLAEKYQILGCYAQTELGHGSNLSRLETTATFIHETDEWELNSTSFTASKWWIGGLGALCTHAVVQALLIIDGKDYGAHVFVVPLRSLEDHQPFPGVELGDIGPKAYGGFNKMDNGYARFNKYRIPRENMLMRFSKVSRDGVYTKPPHAKLSYGSMVLLRSVLIRQMATYLSRATTVSARYLTVRRQFNNPTTRHDAAHPHLETQVINYPMVQNRLFPMIAQSYALFAAGQQMMGMYIQLMQGMSQGKIDALAEVHAMSSALKSYCTTIAAAGVEECRKLMGGHGYSYFTGLAHLFASIVPSNTYEGDNYVLTQQLARYIIKEVKMARTNPDEVTPFSRYLVRATQNTSAFGRETCSVAQDKDWLSLEVQLAAFEHRAARLAVELADNVEGAGTDGNWSDHNIECYRISHAHAQYVMVMWFGQAIQEATSADADSGRPQVEGSTAQVLWQLSHLHALHTIQTHLADFVEDGYLLPSQCQSLRRQVKALVASLADNAVALVDAFDHPDFILNSALGAHDGDAYKRLWDAAQSEPLNQRKVCDGYEEYIRPLLKRHGDVKL
ncbi:acyl-coenzyme A oxidase [Actinomortierella ambigua]|nr:acyl-coenzyme A oxidase [Actinomortierella ambigua]